MKNFYVYIHYRLDNMQPFYVGKGKDYRAYDSRGRNIHWRRIVKAYDFVSVIYQNGLSEEEAFDIEKKLINSIGRHNLGTGPLCNMTEGGDGVAGYVMTEEDKEKISLPVIRNDGKIFPSVKSAAEFMNVSLGEISGTMAKRRSCKGYAFKPYSGQEETWELRSSITNDSQRVAVLRSDGRVFKDVAEAAKETGVNHSLVARLVRGQRGSTKGFEFKKFTGEVYSWEPRIGIIHNRKILRSDGVIFNSVTDAANAVNGSSGTLVSHLKGYRKSHKGYTFSYYNEEQDHKESA